MSQLIRVVNVFHFVLRPPRTIPQRDILKCHSSSVRSMFFTLYTALELTRSTDVMKFPTSKATAYWIVSSHWMTHMSACPGKAHWMKRKSPWDGGRAGMAQWWQRSPSTNVVWVRFWPGAICGFSVLLVLASLRGFFLRVLWFSSFHKTYIFKFKFDQDRGFPL